MTATTNNSASNNTGIDKAALKEKYRQEREKRLRPDGVDQYIRLTDGFGEYLSDPYMEVQPREPKTDHVTVAFIGGGFAGLVTGARLKEAGIDDYRIIEKAGDFGGTWYWNRYPGAQCDTASFVYMPLLEETGHMPTEKYAHAPEILEQCQRIGKQYGLYDNALFHTEVKDLVWDEDNNRWIISTDRGDRFTAQFLGLGTGPLHVPKLPGIPGIKDFKGHSFHTSRWDYSYTGGDPYGAPMDKLRDKSVAIIGTGATAIQCVPHLSRDAGELFVFQRTPSSVDVRNNIPTDPDWFKSISTPGWQKRWLENFTANQTGGFVTEDLVQDGWTDLANRIRSRVLSLPPGEFTLERVQEVWEDCDYEKMEEIRARIDSIVEDTSTAQGLKAWYRQLCKRPCFHDEYLQSFNNPNTHLVDTNGKGVDAITETSVIVAGKEYPVDCIVYASGFEVGTEFHDRCGFDLTGVEGRKLSERWAEGMRTLHGMHVHDFPNAFIVQPTQAGNLISNIPHNLIEGAATIVSIVKHALDNGYQRVEATSEAEQKWVDIILQGGAMSLFNPDCTPGYYNFEGQDPGIRGKLYVGYPQGPMAFFQFIDQWRNSGKFDGLEFS